MTIDDTTVNAVIAQLQQQGWVLTSPPEAARLLGMQDFRAIYCSAVSAVQVSTRLHHRLCPEFYKECGPSGRIQRLRPTPELIAFVNAPGTPRRSGLALMAAGEREGEWTLTADFIDDTDTGGGKAVSFSPSVESAKSVVSSASGSAPERRAV